jgi:hypothetical protein
MWREIEDKTIKMMTTVENDKEQPYTERVKLGN